MNGGISLALAVFLTVFAVSAVSHFTEPRVASSQRAWMESRLADIIPSTSYDNAAVLEQFTMVDPALGDSAAHTVYPFTLNGKWQAAAFTATAPDGYSGAIKLLIAIRADHSLLGVRVLQHQETPGLGDDIELRRSNWITAFDEKSLSTLNDALWTVKKDGGAFDQFTGATITPRAVVHSVYRVLHWHQASGLEKLQQHYHQANKRLANSAREPS